MKILGFNIDENNLTLFYIILVVTIAVELFAFYSLKRKSMLIGIISFIFVGLMHAFLFSSKGLIHTHAIYHVVTILLVTILGLHDNEALDNNKKIGIFFALMAIIFMELEHFKKILKS